MNEETITRLCIQCFKEEPEAIERCAVGQGNYVYIVQYKEEKYVVRCNKETDAYKVSVYWLERLASINIPVPRIIAKGRYGEYEYLILSYIEGKDIGLVYQQLKDDEKRAIAKEIVHIQSKVATLKLENVSPNWSWQAFKDYLLERAETRITKNGYFDVEKVRRLKEAQRQLETYFANVKPIAYLDDISSKNLLIHNGRISGVIDIDWIGIGDKLSFVALTKMALLNLEYDTDYVEHILEEMQIGEAERKAFLFYTLVYCVDFMGERGMQFMDKKIEVNQQVIDRLNRSYDTLWNEWCDEFGIEDNNKESHLK